MTQYTFAHLADLHLGGYRESLLTNLNFKTFQKAIDKILEKKVDFALFAGDIFNNAMPPLDLVQNVTKECLRLKEANIPLYVIGGSHDYSNTQKSFIHLLDAVGVFEDVGTYENLGEGEVNLKVTHINEDIILSGIVGKKNGLDKNIYKNLSKQTFPENKFKIFMFHTTLNDIKPDFMKMVKTEITSNYLPKGFDYYAGGHVHTHIEATYDGALLSYPGPLFPNNFSELKREHPSFNICEIDTETKSTIIKREFIQTLQTEHIQYNSNEELPSELHDSIMQELVRKDLKGKIVLLEISGIVNGSISDINLQTIIKQIMQLGADHVLKNTAKLSTKQIQATVVDDSSSIEEVEQSIISQVTDSEKEHTLFKSLLNLHLDKQEGEKNYQFETRIKETMKITLNNLKQ
jgi:DNA repair exonuclease SbcCD nuclease subunit